MAENRKSKKVAKVPVVMQMEAVECGAACLCMIMAYFGKWIPLEQMRKDCGVSRDGSNAKNLLMAARNHGMVADGYRYELEAIQENGTFPCIIFWEFNHFVVLDGFKKNQAYLNDPARGAVAVTMEEFDQGFSGICLQFAPGENFEKGGKQRSVAAYAMERVRSAGSVLLFTILSSLIATILGIINSGIQRVFMDRIMSYRNPEWTNPFF